MLRVYIIGPTLLASVAEVGFPPLTILILNLAVLSSGAQNIIINRNTRRSNGSQKYKGVRQQYIIKC